MVKTFDCVKCGGNHARPINRNCKEAKINDTQTSEDTNSLILKELKTLNTRMTVMETKVHSLDQMRSPVTSASITSPTPSVASRGTEEEDTDTDLILPSLTSLRTSRDIQEQVDARIRELQISEKGKLKSQRGDQRQYL